MKIYSSSLSNSDKQNEIKYSAYADYINHFKFDYLKESTNNKPISYFGAAILLCKYNNSNNSDEYTIISYECRKLHTLGDDDKNCVCIINDKMNTIFHNKHGSKVPGVNYNITEQEYYEIINEGHQLGFGILKYKKTLNGKIEIIQDLAQCDWRLSTAQKGLIAFFGIIVLFGIAFGAYQLMNKNQVKVETTSQEVTEPNT